MLTLTLDVNEVNAILGALEVQPFNQVAGLINKVRAQAIPQLEEQQKQETPADS